MTDVDLKTAIVEAAEKLRDALADAQKAGLTTIVEMGMLGRLTAFPSEYAVSIRDKDPNKYEVYREVRTVVL